MARVYLTTAANHHLKCANSALVSWGANLATRLRSRGVQVAVARKLAITMLAMWKSGEAYDPNRGIPISAQLVANLIQRTSADRETATATEDLGSRNWVMALSVTY